MNITGNDYEKLLTNNEVQEIVGCPVPFHLYSDIAMMNSIEELFPYGTTKCLILYETSKNRGHWNACMKIDSKNIAVYDSYGKKIDDSLYYIDGEFRNMSNQNEKHLSELLRKSKYNRIHYNPHRHQGREAEINGNKYQISTCGRHCALFMKMGMEPEAYHKFLKKAKKEMGCNNLDELSIKMTKGLL